MEGTGGIPVCWRVCFTVRRYPMQRCILWFGGTSDGRVNYGQAYIREHVTAVSESLCLPVERPHG